MSNFEKLKDDFDTNKDFTIFVDDSEGMTGDVAVSWCISPELSQRMKDSNIHKPVVVLTAVNEAGFEQKNRVCVPLNDMMTFFRFTSPNIKKLKAFIMFDDELSFKELKYKLTTEGYYNKFSTSLVAEDYRRITFGKLWGQNSDAVADNPRYIDDCFIVVNVPEDAFSRPVNRHVQFFLDWMHSSAPKDDCAQRRRFIGLVTWKWPLIVGYAVAMTLYRFIIASVIWLLGWTKTDWKEVFKPWTGSLTGAVSGNYSGYSDWETNELYRPVIKNNYVKSSDEKHGYFLGEVNIYWFPLAPLWMIFLTVVVLIISLDDSYTFTDVATPLYTFGIIVPTLFLLFFKMVWNIVKKTPYWKYELHLQLYSRSKTENITGIMAIPMFTLVGIATLASMVMFVIKVMAFPLFWLSDKFEKAMNDYQDRIIKKESIKNDFSMNEDILCHNIAENHVPSLDTIPTNRISYGLKVQKFKQKVCKPLIR